MFDIIIADDEPVLANGLQKLIDWEELGCNIVGTAYNGAETLELLLATEPDIAVLDICMPEMTGIELIKRINKDHLKTRVIFISGYQDFFYAQEAVNQGALEYLLKPVEESGLEQAIKKAQILISKQNPMSLMEGTRNELQEMFGDINRYEEYAEGDLYERFTRLGLEVEDRRFICICYAISDKDREIAAGSQYDRYELIRFSVYNRIQDYFAEHKKGFVVKRDDECCSIMILLTQKDGECITRDYVPPFVGMVEREYGMELFAGVGDVVQKITDMKYAYKTAKFSFEMRFFEEKPLIIYRDINRDYSKSFEDYQEAYDAVAKKILLANRDIEKELGYCLDMIESLHYGNRYAALNRCFSFSVNLLQLLEEYQLLETSCREREDEFLNRLRGLTSYYAVRKEFVAHYMELAKSISEKAGNKDKHVVTGIKDYIQKNYAENITLALLERSFT